MADKKIRIKEAAKLLGINPQTLRNWEKAGKIKPERSSGNQRYYLLEHIRRFSLDIQALGLAWASSAVAPELPTEYYCERPDRFTSRVARMGIELQKSFPEEEASLLTLVAGEIGDNSFAHNVGNWPDAPGVFYAYDIQKRMIVIADRGRGVKTTLRQVKPELQTDFDALNVAFTEVVSGRNPEKRGNGLKVVRRVIESRNIGLHFHSGTAQAKIPIEKPAVLEIRTADRHIPGTFSVIMF